MSTEPSDPVAEAARAQAEARRRRILEGSAKRMGVVSGEQAQNDDEKKLSASKAARIRAMRQKRYGKKTAAGAATTSQNEAEDTSAPKVETTSPSDKKENSSVSESPMVDVKEEINAPSDEKAEKDTNRVEKAPETNNEKSPESSSITEKKSVEDVVMAPKEEGKKKYLGVAKMRRKMIMKKKIATQEETSAKEEASATSDAKSFPVASANVSNIPTYMHVFTICLLFLAGLDVGFQQYHEDVRIYNEFSITEHGIPLLHRSLWQDSKQGSPSPLEKLQGTNSASGEMSEDEFAEDPEAMENVPNIDPVFRVDLDELTKGPGLLNQMARGAVAVHRLIVWALYYMPISVFQNLLALPRTLIQTPPVLCALALILRQVVGKTILRAGIPAPEAEEKSNAIDVLAMVKQWITNFLSSAFPTAVGFYDAFVHLRTDMYIIVCGVFVGMAWTHLSTEPATTAGGSASDMTGTDEL